MLNAKNHNPWFPCHPWFISRKLGNQRQVLLEAPGFDCPEKERCKDPADANPPQARRLCSFLRPPLRAVYLIPLTVAFPPESAILTR